MNRQELKKIANLEAAQVAAACELDEEARGLLTAGLSASDYLTKLEEQGLFADAVRFLAAGLPKREAVWWACLCARSTLHDPPEPPLLKAIEGAETWVYKPTEAHRRATEKLAEQASFDQPAAWAAMAAFWSGGSMAPEGQPAVPPADDLTGKAASGAITLAAATGDAARIDDRYQDFLRKGLNIADGGDGRSSEKSSEGDPKT
jgi:hypothetical protein